MERFVPKVDHSFSRIDSEISDYLRAAGLKGNIRVQWFHYLADYLGSLREGVLVSLLRFPIKDYAFIRLGLPVAHLYANGQWRTHDTRFGSLDEAHLRRAITCLVNIAIRLESAV